MEYVVGKQKKNRQGEPIEGTYADKVYMGTPFGAVRVSLSNDWANQGYGVSISGAMAIGDLPKLVEWVNANAAEAIALWESRQKSGFVAETAPFVPSTPATLSDDRLDGVPAGEIGELPGVGRIVTLGNSTYRMATAAD